MQGQNRERFELFGLQIQILSFKKTPTHIWIPFFQKIIFFGPKGIGNDDIFA